MGPKNLIFAIVLGSALAAGIFVATRMNEPAALQTAFAIPTTLQVLANVKRQLIDTGAKTIPRIVLVSVDPERDTPEILGRYVDYFGEGNLGITGEIEGITTLTAALGIYFEKAPTPDGNYSVDHSAAVLVINPDGEFSALFGAPHVVANYLHDLPIIMSKN